MELVNRLLLEGKIYLFLYLLLWILVIFESSKYFSQYKKTTFLCSSIILWLFIGLRWETGTDWNSYKELFDSLELNWTFLFNIYHFDIGYVLFNALTRLFTNSYTIFLILNSGITIYFLYKLIRKLSPYPNLSLFFFYANFMIAQFMGSNRRMMAMVFVLWAFYYIFYEKKVYSAINIGLAFVFHRSSIINITSYFIPRTLFTIRTTILILLCSLLIGLLQIPAKLVDLIGNTLIAFVNNPIVENMVYYSETNEEHLVYSTGSLFLSTLLAVLKRTIFLVFYIYITRRNNVDKLTQFFYNIYIIGFAGYLFFIGSFFQMLTAFFTFIEVILIGRMYSYVNGSTKLLFICMLFLYGFLQMMNAVGTYPEQYLPYLPFWTDIHRL